MDDPREALLRLRDQLTGLEERLARQEDDLRGASEDVARGIDVQIRKARGQVSRLNQNLGGVSFGSIDGIRVKVQSVERMEQVLRALREGAVQGLLFQENLPIEEALDEIFRRYGGGRSGGQRLLDYREYVHLQVEVRRTAGSDWEVANPTRLSTGEAIGVGAALMMVVLTEWERDANLLRGKRAHGSLRFLFLDEANRLSHDNLGVLFDLCQTLDLQLLIAAPEVARAEGNTTYRLVRRVDADGREEVLVERAKNEGRGVIWESDNARLALLELLSRGSLKRRRTQLEAYDALAELPWTRATGRRDEIGVVEERRTELAGLIDRVWPAWRDVLADLVAAGLPPTPDGYGRLLDMERAAAIPELPERINRRTAASLTASHSKASLTEARRGALGGTDTSHDGAIRLRPPAWAVGSNGKWNRRPQRDRDGARRGLDTRSEPCSTVWPSRGPFAPCSSLRTWGRGVTYAHHRAGCWPTCPVGTPPPSVTCSIVSMASPSCTSVTWIRTVCESCCIYAGAHRI